MEQQIIANGGLQYVPQIAVQYVYLDFDGESTSYNGELLTVDNVEVKDSSLTEERINSIVAELNAKYAAQNVIFVTERPTAAEYSTIYIGKTESFSPYGNFVGLAESIDEGNKNKSDKAFVMLDSTTSDEQIISTISHETAHLLGTLNHGGEGLEAYACHYYYNTTYTGVLSDYLYLSHNSVNYESGWWCSCGSSYYEYDKATNVTIASDGSLYVDSGATATDITLNNGGRLVVDRGATATNITLNDGGELCVVSGATATNITFNNGGWLNVSSGATATNITLNNGVRLDVLNGATVTNITLNDGAWLYVDSGATVMGVIYSVGEICNDGSMIIDDYAVFSGNATRYDGGAIDNYGSMTIGAYAVFAGNSAYYGGAIDNGGAIYNDGTIYAYGGSMNIGDYAVFSGNSAAGGGAIRNDGSMTIGDYAVFAGNWASYDGGAIYNDGVIYTDGGSMTIGDNVVFSGNSANNGGAIYNDGGSMTIGDSAVFAGNSASYDGGAIGNYGSMTIGDYAVFAGNMAHTDGGTVYNCFGGSMTIGDSAVFSGNSASYDGGAIVNDGGIMTIGDYAVFSGNSASYDGGAIYNDYGSMTIGDSAVFSGNSGGSGGAIGNYGSMTIGDNAVFAGNSASYGGAIYNLGGSMIIGDYAVFAGNVASNGGAIYNSAYLTRKYNSATAGYDTVECRGQITLGDVKFATYTDTIYNTGDIILNGDASFAGNITIAEEKTYYGTSVGALQNNGNIDFNISVRVEDDGLLLNDWELVSGDGTYSITVDDKQVAGEYQLIGNAANFNKTITVRNEEGSKKGELSLDMEEPLELRNMSLMLKLDEETNIVSVVVDSEYSERTDREKQETQIKLPDTAFAGMTYGNYTLTQAPDWLSIDPTTGKFSGTTGKISDTATGYGTTEVIITATKGEETKKHTIEVVVLPENIKGDGIIEESISGNMTDLIADAVANRNEDPYDSTLLTWLPFLPNKKIAWNYCGLDISLSELYYGVSVTDTDYIITLQGKLNFTIFDSGKTVDQRTSLTVDFSGEDKDESWSDYDGPKYIKVTTPHDFASVKFDVVGSMEFENFALGNGFLLKEGSISVDTERDIWSGSAEIEFTHFNKTIEAEFTVIGKRVDSLTVKVSGLNIAVGATGFFINSIGGGVENISGYNDEPLTLIANMGLSYGKKITLIDGKEFYLVTADLEVSVSSESFTGSGDIEVLGGILSGSVSVTVDWKDSTFTAQGAVNLYKLATAQGCIKIDGSGNITYSAASILDFSQFGFGFSATANMLLNFSNDGNNSNDYYAAWSTREYCGIQQTFGVKFNLDGSWELLGTEKVKKINDNDNPMTYSLRRSRSIPPVTGSWDLSGVSGIVLLSAQWESGETEFLLTDGNGNTYTKEDIAKRSDMEIVESMSNDKTLVIAVKDPVEGIWSLSIANGTNVEIDANILNGKSSVAAPSLTAEAGNGRDITVTWNCPELPENAELCIYYDTDSSGNDGVLLAQIVPDENSGTYTWTVPDALAGELRFYAVLSSPDLLPAVGTYTSAIAMEAKEQLVEVDSSGWTYVAGGFYVQDAGITAGGVLEIDGGSLRGDTSVAKNSEIILDEATVSGTLTLAGFMTVRSNIDAADMGIIFDLTNRSLYDDYMIDDISLLSGTPEYSVIVTPELTLGDYKLAQGAENFNGNITVGDKNSTYGTISCNGEYIENCDKFYSLRLKDGNLVLSVSVAADPELSGNKDGISFDNIPEGTRIVEYSQDDFKTALQVQPNGNAVDTYGMPAGTYQWLVTVNGTAHQGENIAASRNSEVQKFASDADGNMDVFFANANGTWEAGYMAQHIGILNGWEGTKEFIKLSGKNKLSDIFEGSTDANILVMTDDVNGDALFVDDIYTALPGSVTEQQARIAKIDEIRAGFGDDIVDMTSQQFAYIGDGVKIYGGLGNDTIGSNNGNNMLFGDAGNDRIVGGANNDVIVGGIGNDSMHGGGGNDTFCFGKNWGKDAVEQLAGGEITLWFESGEMGNWDADTLTYTDGTNSVTVRGVAEVSLKFGGNAPVNGAFLDAVSEKIFEEKDKGMLA